MSTGEDRAFAEVADDFETWRQRARELLGCGPWETRWRLAGGLVVVMEDWGDEIDPCVLCPRTLPPLMTMPAIMPGERREAWFREAHRQLDQGRAARLGKDGQGA